MTPTEWLFFGITFAALFFAVWSLRVAGSYKQQVENVQMAASIARDQNVAQRHVNDALTRVVRAYEGQLVEARRRYEVVEQMNRMLIAAQPKPRAPRKPAARKATPRKEPTK